jgi:hypothetical protein
VLQALLPVYCFSFRQRGFIVVKENNKTRVIARHEAIPYEQSGFASLPVKYGIASYLAMTLWKWDYSLLKNLMG